MTLRALICNIIKINSTHGSLLTMNQKDQDSEWYNSMLRSLWPLALYMYWACAVRNLPTARSLEHCTSIVLADLLQLLVKWGIPGLMNWPGRWTKQLPSCSTVSQQAAACNFTPNKLTKITLLAGGSLADSTMYFSIGSPFGEKSLVTVMIMPGGWPHSSDQEPLELEGKYMVKLIILMPRVVKHNISLILAQIKNDQGTDMLYLAGLLILIAVQ